MTDVLIRTKPSGRVIVGRAYARMRRGSPGLEAKPAHDCATLDAALSTAKKLCASNGSEPEPTRSRGDVARLRNGLTPQGRKVLALLESRTGGVTARECAEAIEVWSLRDRVRDIRRVYGYDSVETVMEPNGNGGRHGRYHWRGT